METSNDNDTSQNYRMYFYKGHSLNVIGRSYQIENYRKSQKNVICKTVNKTHLYLNKIYLY